MHKIFSSGGLGDSLIVGLKISQTTQHRQGVVWENYEKHEVHKNCCETIQDKFAGHSKCIIVDKPEKEALAKCQEEGGIYLNTKITEVVCPYLNKPIDTMGYFNNKIFGIDDYVLVQAQAGRMNDNTRREIGPEVLNQLLDAFPSKPMVVVGPEKAIFSTKDMRRIINLTGETPSILNVVELINNCSLFVGQDGFMAYYSAMIKKPTIIHYHLPNLPSHYWHGRWSSHCIGLTGLGNFISKLPIDNEIIVKLIK